MRIFLFTLLIVCFPYAAFADSENIKDEICLTKQKFFEKSVELYVQAKNYEEGKCGFKEDVDEAIRLYTKSAKLGNINAQRALADLYISLPYRSPSYEVRKVWIESFAWYMVISKRDDAKDFYIESAKTQMFNLKSQFELNPDLKGAYKAAKLKGNEYFEKYALP